MRPRGIRRVVLLQTIYLLQPFLGASQAVALACQLLHEGQFHLLYACVRIYESVIHCGIAAEIRGVLRWHLRLRFLYMNCQSYVASKLMYGTIPLLSSMSCIFGIVGPECAMSFV